MFIHGEVTIMHAMTYDEFQRHIGKAGLRLNQFADLVKMNRVSLSNYGKQGHVPSHLAVIAALMGELVDNGLTLDVLKRIEIAPKKPRGAGIGKFGGDKSNSNATPN